MKSTFVDQPLSYLFAHDSSELHAVKQEVRNATSRINRATEKVKDLGLDPQSRNQGTVTVKQSDGTKKVVFQTTSNAPERSAVTTHEMPSVLSKNSIPPTRIDKGEKKAQTTPAVSVKEKVEVPKPKSKPVVKAPAPKPVVKPAAVSIKPEVKKPNVNVSRPKPKAAPPRSMPANLKPSFKVSKPKAPSGSIPSARNISRPSSSGNSRPSGNHTFGRGFF